MEVLRQAAHAPSAQVEVVLISPDAQATYSGMLPGVIGGRHTIAAAQIDLRALADQAGAAFIGAAVSSVHGAQQWVEFEGERLAFDACSLDVGSAASIPPASADAPLALLRPVSQVLALPRRLLALPSNATCVVIGGGAAGIEIACAIHARARRDGKPLRVTILQRESTILPGFPAGVQRAIAGALVQRGIAIETDVALAHIDAGGVHRADGTTLPADLVIWAAGAAATPLLASSTLPRSARGYLAVDDTLRATDGTPVWGAGDCIDLISAPWMPKSGVYAVRQGPVLAHNLLAYLDGRPPRRYTPQRHSLAILDLADGTACAARGQRWWRSRWLRWVKDVIDRRFIAKYR